MQYQFYELQRSMLANLTSLAKTQAAFQSNNSFPSIKYLTANLELLQRLSKDYEKPRFNIDKCIAHNKEIAIAEHTFLQKPFCNLVQFKRYANDSATINKLNKDPVVLLCAPLSGHHATLLRETVRSLLTEHKVYITDWIDARNVPLSQSTFHLHDYIIYIQEFIRILVVNKLHIISVCQPSVPVLAAIALMTANGEPIPASITMMGGPVDARQNPTAVNSIAMNNSLTWFEQNMITIVPNRYLGVGRRVYPGFLQHACFVALNYKRHAKAYMDFYQNIINDDKQAIAKHIKFYDEYNAVLDMDADYYLETVKTVFQDFSLAKGTLEILGQKVQPNLIKDTALLTIEGEFDDISGIGQTKAAHNLCTSIPEKNKEHYLAMHCGHYGIFSGRRWQEMIYPKIAQFIRSHDKKISKNI